MLQTIRDHTQGWIAGVIISILILMFALWGINAYFAGGNAGTVVAKVNGVNITKERFTVAYEQARRQMQAHLGSPLASKQETGLKEQVLQDLISTEILKQASWAQHYRISSFQIDSYLESIPEFQENGQFSMTKFREIMATSLYTANDLIDLIKTTLLIAQPKLGIILTSIGLPNEVNETIALVNQERDISYLMLSLTSLNRKVPTVSPEEMNAYYKEHQAEFKTPEQVSVEYIQLSLKNLMNTIHPTPEMLKNFYNENINNYTQPAQWKLAAIVIPVTTANSPSEVEKAQEKAADILQKLHRGENFEKLASQYAEPSVQAELQGWVSFSQVPSAYQKPLLLLTKNNPISEVIHSERGLVILKMLDKKETQIQSFEQVKNKVNDTLIRQQAEEKMAILRDQLADLTYENPDSLLPAAKNLGMPIQSTVMFTQDKGGQDISAHKKVRDTAFSNEVLSSQNNSDLIQLNPETVVVLRVKAHLPPTLLLISAVSKQIQDRLQREKSKHQLEQLADKIVQKLQKGSTETQIAQEYQLNWTSLGFIGRYSNKISSAILDGAFRLPQLSHKNSYGVVQLPNSYAVIALHAVKNGIAKDKNQEALFAQQVENSEGTLEYELYKESLMKGAKVVIEQQ